jgi:hypothetical protein
VPFIRVTRDKRGYETTFVVHTYRSAKGAPETRVLYLFRSPAGISFGRRPLDDEARVALEHTHPDLSFDWQAISQEALAVRSLPARPQREVRGARVPSARASGAPAVVVEDQTLVGRVLGAAEATRLRGRYRELIERIQRRARTPEERDQLLERARRLNPDDWGDEMSVRAGVSTVEAEWDAIGSALPQRRRGRRGGRRRGLEPPPEVSPPSGIMAEDGDLDERAEDPEVARSHRPAADSGDDDRVGGSGAGHDFPSDD